jgi:hypothetical protein
VTPTLSDEHLRALRFLARQRGGFDDAMLLAQGFTTGQLGSMRGLPSYEE